MSALQKHPLLCWRLGEGLVGGVLVGTSLALVRADTKKLTAAFSADLRRPEAPALPEPIESPRLKRVPVPFRPTYRAAGSDYPMPEAIAVPIDVVHGSHPGGGSVCYLPRLGRQFYFEEPDQLDALVRHFAREELRDMAPEALYRSLIVAPPWLELVTVRAPKVRSHRWRRPPPETPRLAQIAEALPGRRRPGSGPAAAWERTAEVGALKALIGQPRGNILLVGEPGVGKSTILRSAVRELSRLKDAPPFWRTSAQRLTAGAKYLGDWQELCEQLAGELAMINGILWVEDFVALMTTGGSSPEDSVAAFWSPLLDRGELRLMCEVSPRSLDTARGLLPSFVARFQQLPIDELRPAQVRTVIRRYADQSERDLSVAFTPRARRLSSRLLRRHVRYERFPGKAIRLLSDCLHRAQAAGTTEVDEDDIMERFIARTGMPRELLDDRIVLQPEAVRSWFSERIIGQPEAVEEVGRVIKTFKAGLSDPARPLATMLFAGPTGVGKTAMARSMAGYFFGASADEAPIIRLDMSELQFAGQIDRLIGSTGGEPGELIRRLRQQPFSVVLFDEIEKANPIFFDLLLTVLDEGILVDALGRETDFRGSVVIMTTNLGTGRGGSLGFSKTRTGHDPSAVRQFFRPEFFNRIDRVVRFAPLDADAAAQIARLELSSLQKREGLRARSLRLDFTDALIRHLVDVGFDPDYGARALQRIIEQQVVSPIGRFLLAHTELRDATLCADYQDGAVEITRQ